MYEVGDELKSLTDSSNTLLESTARAAGKRYHDAVEALEEFIERGKSIYGVARQRAVNDTKIVDRAIHDHLYQTLAIGIGLGVFLGYFLSRPRD